MRRKGRYVSETFVRREEARRWALDAENQIDRGETPMNSRLGRLKTFGELVDLHIEDMCEVGKAPGRSKQATLNMLTRPSRLREIIDSALAREGLAPTTILEVDSLPAVIRMVARGVGCTLLPYSTVADEVDRGELQALRMPGSPPRRTLLLARPLDRPASVGTRAIEAELRDIVCELSPRMGWDAASSG